MRWNGKRIVSTQNCKNFERNSHWRKLSMIMVWERYCNASPKPELFFIFFVYIFLHISANNFFYYESVWVEIFHRWFSIQKQVNWCIIDPFSLKFCTSQHSYPVPLMPNSCYHSSLHLIFIAWLSMYQLICIFSVYLRLSIASLCSSAVCSNCICSLHPSLPFVLILSILNVFIYSFPLEVIWVTLLSELINMQTCLCSYLWIFSLCEPIMQIKPLGLELRNPGQLCTG